MTDIKVTKDCYKIAGKRYDRVTAVLDYFVDKGLVEWRDRVGVANAKETMKTAKANGTRIHTLTEDVDKGKYIRFTDYDSISVKNCIEGYKRWKETEKPTILSAERTVWSDELGIAGTFDRELVDTLVDIKSSNRIDRKYWLQLGIYNYMLPEPKEKLAVLRLDKMTSEYEYKVVPYDIRYAKCYIGLLQYYRFITYKPTRGDKDGDNIADGEIQGGLGVFETEISDARGFEDWKERVLGTGR